MFVAHVLMKKYAPRVTRKEPDLSVSIMEMAQIVFRSKSLYLQIVNSKAIISNLGYTVTPA